MNIRCFHTVLSTLKDLVLGLVITGGGIHSASGDISNMRGFQRFNGKHN